MPAHQTAVLLAAAAVAAALVASAAPDHPGAHVPDLVLTRAHHVLRALDADGDGRVGAREVAGMRDGAERLAEFFPGSDGHAEFAAFVEAADSDGDGLLDEAELGDAVRDGLRDSPEFLELDALSGRAGFFSGIKRVVKKVWNGAKKVVNAVFGGGSKDAKAKKTDATTQAKNEQCVMCQYLVERMETNVKTSGVLPRPGDDSVGAVNGGGGAAGAASFVELGAEAGGFDTPGQVNARRAAVHEQRLFERRKYNQIYRVVDITLDDVCEAAMPDAQYAHCKEIYKVQADVVDGLRYQYRPSDICYKIGMCQKGSYITEGLHNKARFAAIEQAQKREQENKACTDPMLC